jgi:peptidyl-prolyl cis-trans isomerase C
MKFKIPRYLIAILLFGVSVNLSSCSTSSSSSSEIKNNVYEMWSDFFTNTSSEKDPIVATAGDLTIHASDVKARYLNLPLNDRRFYSSSPKGKSDLLQKQINFEILSRKARDQGLGRDPLFRSLMKTYKQTLLARRFEDEFIRRETVSTAEVYQYFQSHFQDYNRRAEVKASMILVRTPADAKKAQALLKKKPFADVAWLLSIDKTTAMAGGKMVPFLEGSQSPSVEQALRPLQAGQTSTIVATPVGYGIFKKDSYQSLAPIALESAAPEIMKRLKQDKFIAWVQQTRKSAGIVVYDNALDSVQLSTSSIQEK